MNEKVLLVKFGWSVRYDGSSVTGDFSYLDEAAGAEAYNFSPKEGTYYGYVAPSGQTQAPKHLDPQGWTVLFTAKEPKKTGIHLVGWYENATLTNEILWNDRSGHEHCYAMTSSTAFLVPIEHRVDPFSDSHVKSLKYSFLTPAELAEKPWKVRVLTHLLDNIKAIRNAAIANPGM